MNKWLPLSLSLLLALPGPILRLLEIHPSAPVMALVAGTAILAASFLLLWACDVAQMDIPQSLALAVVAFIAVLPEYAVDMYFTWMAGQHPESSYAHYAIANMTGANRLLIGVAWAAVAGLFWLKTRNRVTLAPERRTEVLFLGLATAYAMLVPIKGSLTWYDGMVLVGLYVWYIRLAGKRPCEECELHGTADLIGSLPKNRRRAATIALFLFAAGVILACAEPFSESLVASGKIFGVDEFLLVQWLAPIASEAPEFIVAIMFVLRGDAATALGSLLSAKLNQWTLLVGMIPWVYAVSSGGLSPIPLDHFQMQEVLLTAAQSLLAVAMLAGLTLGPRAAAVLFVLFVGQLVSPLFLAEAHIGIPPSQAHPFFSALYLASFTVLAFHRRREILELRRGFTI
ncbi:sodium:calcium antiporter [Desulfovibrio aminophilus]|uniref:sodium:calcium antiporter n=1 Tax=Desulfovibrio aminophilus TaxID=81425 RepID=UPI0033912974